MNLGEVIHVAIYVLGVLSLLFGVIGGLYAGLRWIRRTFLSPRIRLTFEPDKTFQKSRDAKTGIKHVWLHVRAHNASNEVLSGCKAYLTQVRIISADHSIAPVPDFKSKLPLAWAHSGGLQRMDILPEEEVGIDLFMVDHMHKVLITCTDQIPAGTQKCFPPGEYVLQIKCFSSNAKPGSIRLHIVWDGKAAKPSVEVIDDSPTGDRT